MTLERHQGQRQIKPAVRLQVLALPLALKVPSNQPLVGNRLLHQFEEVKPLFLIL